MTARQDLVELVAAVEAGTRRRPAIRAGASCRRDPGAQVRRAAVLMLFGALDNVPAASGKLLAPADLDVLLLQRAQTLDDHPGQVAFPGGGIDPGESPIEAALREAEEETGLDPAGVEVLGAMPELALPRGNFLVTPVLAWWAFAVAGPRGGLRRIRPGVPGPGPGPAGSGQPGDGHGQPRRPDLPEPRLHGQQGGGLGFHRE